MEETNGAESRAGRLLANMDLKGGGTHRRFPTATLEALDLLNFLVQALNLSLIVALTSALALDDGLQSFL